MCVEIQQYILTGRLLKALVRLAYSEQYWTRSTLRVVRISVRARRNERRTTSPPTFTMSAHVRSSGTCTKQPSCDCSKRLPPDIPPGNALRGDRTDGFLSRRERLARGRPSGADEGVEETKGLEGERGQLPEAGTTRGASVALATPPLPLKR